MRRGLMWFLAAVVVGAAAYARTSMATPSSGFTATTLAMARFDEIAVNLHTQPANFWQSRQMTKGLSDVYVQSNVWAPGGTSGWHTHPGHSLILVTAGTITAYEGDDPSCTAQVYTQGMGFVDQGGGHVHVLRNEGEVEARTIAVQLIPAAAVRRIDVPAPGNCSF
jgi:Cupin domain